MEESGLLFPLSIRRLSKFLIKFHLLERSLCKDSSPLRNLRRMLRHDT